MFAEHIDAPDIAGQDIGRLWRLTSAVSVALVTNPAQKCAPIASRTEDRPGCTAFDELLLHSAAPARARRVLPPANTRP
jgi:hypothetical protein